MSQTEHKRWKLIPQLDKHEPIEDCCLRILRREEIGTDKSIYEDTYKSIVLDELYQDYYIWESQVYKIEVEDVDNDEDIATAKILTWWEIEIELKWYNWWAGIDEMIEQALTNIKTR